MKRENNKVAQVTKKVCYAFTIIGAAIFSSLLWAVIMFPGVIVYDSAAWKTRILVLGIFSCIALLAAPARGAIVDTITEEKKRRAEWKALIDDINSMPENERADLLAAWREGATW